MPADQVLTTHVAALQLAARTCDDEAELHERCCRLATEDAARDRCAARARAAARCAELIRELVAHALAGVHAGGTKP